MRVSNHGVDCCCLKRLLSKYAIDHSGIPVFYIFNRPAYHSPAGFRFGLRALITTVVVIPFPPVIPILVNHPYRYYDVLFTVGKSESMSSLFTAMVVYTLNIYNISEVTNMNNKFRSKFRFSFMFINPLQM